MTHCVPTMTISLSSSDPFSSSYQFSIHDTASFTANMLLSNREEHPRFLRTELCLSGRVSYNTNILTVSVSHLSVCLSVCWSVCLSVMLYHILYVGLLSVAAGSQVQSAPGSHAHSHPLPHRCLRSHAIHSI